ncbi:MAG: DUF6599 family protein [Terriglobia bacterium]|jgi:hypothetical protein
MAREKVRQFALLLALAGIATGASAQGPTVIPLVPAANWHLVSAEPMAVEVVRQYGGDPAIEREYGVKTPVLRKYHLGEKQAEALLEEALDPTAAYGLFTFYRSETLHPAKGMELTLIGPSAAAMVRGRIFIRAWTPAGSRTSEDDLQALMVYIGGTRPNREGAASLPTPLPGAGLIPGSEKYLLGLEAARRILPTFRTDIIGFEQGAEAQVGTYAVGRDRPTLVAINYPTPQIARVRYGAMESLLGINQDHGANSVYGRRNASYVILVLGAPGSSAAQQLINQFQVKSNVSWNEPAPKREAFILGVVRMVLANIMLSFIISGFAVGGGVMIFLSRRLATRFFPQWTWADPEHETIIRLNLDGY